MQRARAASKDGTVHILALSGGGAGGAFGAGALVGLSRRGERPLYEIVTGVSAGALISVFAFLGSQWDDELTEAFRSGRSEHLLSRHGLIGLFRHGAYRSGPLISLVDHFVTRDLVEAVAREAGKGRLLLVATTDLDKEETVIWDMGVIAARGGEPARKLFRDVLVASSSIPGLFSPVMIQVEDAGVTYEEMHVDGGTTGSLFVAPEAAFFAPLDPNSMKGTSIYALFDGQMGSAPSTTRYKTGPILVRSFSTALKHMSRTELTAAKQFAEKYGIAFRVTGVPVDYPKVSPLDFRAAMMRSLFDYAADCAQKGLLWATIDQAFAREVLQASGELPTKRPPGLPQTPRCPL